MESALISGNFPQKLYNLQRGCNALIPRSNSIFTRGGQLPGRLVFIQRIRSMKSSDSPNDERRIRPIKAVVVSSSFALTCALGILGIKLMNPTGIAGARQMVYQKAPRTEAPITPMGGKAALKSLMDVTTTLTSNSHQIERLRPLAIDSLPSRASNEDVDAMKMEALRLMKLGKPEEAVDYLQQAYRRYEHEPATAYNVQLVLVEVLICQGRYEEADECQCLNVEENIPSDVRPLLYKAITCTMLNSEDEAREYWKAFRKSIGEGFDPFGFPS